MPRPSSMLICFRVTPEAIFFHQRSSSSRFRAARRRDDDSMLDYQITLPSKCFSRSPSSLLGQEIAFDW